MATEERFINLESRIAHQDQSIHELSDELYRQRKQLEQLEATCQRLLERIRTLTEPTGNEDHGTEQPPHY